MNANQDLFRPDLPRIAHKIVCLIPDGIGTTLRTTPTLSAIRQKYPNAIITVILNSNCSSLLTESICDYCLSPPKTSRFAKLRFYASLRQQKFDILFDFHTPHRPMNAMTQSSFSTDVTQTHLWHRLLIKAKCTIGFDKTLNSALNTTIIADWINVHSAFTISVPCPKTAVSQAEHQADTTLRLVIDSHKITIAARLFPLKAPKVYKDINYSQPHKIALFFGGHHQSSHWPLDYVIELIVKILASRNVRFHIIGGNQETNVKALLHDALRKEINDNQVVMHIGQTNLGETSAIIGQCQLMISTLSGPFYLADAHNIPIIALASSNKHVPHYQARQARQILLQVPVHCSPCLKSICEKSVSCMEQMSVMQVVAAYDAMLADRFAIAL